MKINRLFSDHMVLQREKPLEIWGTGNEGERVEVHIQGASAQTVVTDGAWRLMLPALKTSFGEEMLVQGDSDTITIKDVAVGEVWLAGGQSNMEFQMLFDSHYSAEQQGCENANIRFYDVPEISYEGQDKDFDYHEMGFWRKCDAENLKYYSAVGYYMAKKLSSDMNIPVGIIGCNWGGTTASCWMDEQSLRKHGVVWLSEYEEGLKKITDMDGYQEKFRKNPANSRGLPFEYEFTMLVMPGISREEQLESMKHVPDFIDESVFLIGPLSQNRPCGLYETMLKKAAPYTIRGVIWYQGESDAVHADIYKEVFSDMTASWRDLWKEQLPFITVQLAPFEIWLDNEGKEFPTIREAQRLASIELEQVYMVSSSDVGMRHDIHPKEKKPIGERLALSAEKNIYGFDIEGDAPVVDSVETDGSGIKIYFKHAGSGLKIAGEHLSAMVVEKSGKAVDYRAELIAPDCLRIHVEECKDVSVSFAQTDYYEVNLYNSSGIPAIPFQFNL